MRAPLLLLAAAAAGDVNICTNFRPRLRSATMCLYNNTDTCSGGDEFRWAVKKLLADDIERFKITPPTGGCVRFGANVMQGMRMAFEVSEGESYSFVDDCDAEYLLGVRSNENYLVSRCDKGCFQLFESGDDDDNQVLLSGTIADCALYTADDDGLGPGEIAGVVVGVIVLLALVYGCVAYSASPPWWPFRPAARETLIAMGGGLHVAQPGG